MNSMTRGKNKTKNNTFYKGEQFVIEQSRINLLYIKNKSELYNFNLNYKKSLRVVIFTTNKTL